MELQERGVKIRGGCTCRFRRSSNRCTMQCATQGRGQVWIFDAMVSRFFAPRCQSAWQGEKSKINTNRFCQQQVPIPRTVGAAPSITCDHSLHRPAPSRRERTACSCFLPSCRHEVLGALSCFSRRICRRWKAAAFGTHNVWETVIDAFPCGRIFAVARSTRIFPEVTCLFRSSR